MFIVATVLAALFVSQVSAQLESNDGSSNNQRQLGKLQKLINNEPRADSSNNYAAVSRRGSSQRDPNAIDEEILSVEPYAFGYNVKDDFGNNQYRKEEATDDGVIKGSYGYTDAAGLYRVVEYIADKLGFRTKIRSNEPGLKSMSSSSIVLDVQEPPEAVVAAASVRREVTEKPSEAVTGSASRGLNPRFRYITSSSELRSQARSAPVEPKKQENTAALASARSS